MNRNFALLAVAAALALSGVTAHASCADPRAALQNGAAHAAPALPAGVRSIAGWDHHQHDSIVGTWVVTYTMNDNPFGDAFIQWHDDGTEWENIDFPILGGNVCMGEWQQTGHRQVQRTHIGWLYTDGTVSGYFTETETDTLSRDGNSYTGTNDMKIFDMNGVQQGEMSGTSSATRYP